MVLLLCSMPSSSSASVGTTVDSGSSDNSVSLPLRRRLNSPLP